MIETFKRRQTAKKIKKLMEREKDRERERQPILKQRGKRKRRD